MDDIGMVMGCFDAPNKQKMRIYAKKVNKLLAVSKIPEAALPENLSYRHQGAQVHRHTFKELFLGLRTS